MPSRDQGTAPPFFSVVIATRNRPALFRQALESVVAQASADVEINVVNDGSEAEHQLAYDAVLAAVPRRVRSFSLVRRPNGHGGSYALNFGAAQASAPYLCFLDDDDLWTDPGHLARAQTVIAESEAPVDLYMTNQAAYLRGEKRLGAIWLDDLPAILSRRGGSPDRRGAHAVTVEDLLQSQGFCHLNILIVRRALFEEIGGLDEANRWEYDRDLYLRLIDRAAVMKYVPITTARHNIPDPTAAANITTRLSEFERRLYQIRALDRVIYFGRHPGLRAHGRLHKAYALKRLAEALAAAGRHVDAAFYAREALGAGPTVKWAGYTAWRTLSALAERSRRR